MPGIKVLITKCVDDSAYPPIVECLFEDTDGKTWLFVEKEPVVSAAELDGDFPSPGVIACEIVSKSRDKSGNEILEVDTERPWGIFSVEGRTRFSVYPDQLTEVNRAV